MRTHRAPNRAKQTNKPTDREKTRKKWEWKCGMSTLSNKKAESSHATNDKNQQNKKTRRRRGSEKWIEPAMSTWAPLRFVLHFSFRIWFQMGSRVSAFFSIRFFRARPSSAIDDYQEIDSMPTIEIELDWGSTHRIILQICWDAFFEGVNFNSEKSVFEVSALGCAWAASIATETEA